MDSERQDVDALRLLHEQHSKTFLVDITNRLVAKLAGVTGHTPIKGFSTSENDDSFLREVYSLSKAWDRFVKRGKITEAAGQWKRLLDACYNAELEFLRQQGYPKKSATKLVRREQAWWDPDSSQFVTGL